MRYLRGFLGVIVILFLFTAVVLKYGRLYTAHAANVTVSGTIYQNDGTTVYDCSANFHLVMQGDFVTSTRMLDLASDEGE